MSKKTYFLVLILVVIATYLAYSAAFRPASQKTPTSPPTQVTIPVYQATLAFSPSPLIISPTLIQSPGSLDVVIDTGSKKATAVQLELSYDPKVLTNIELSPGTFFDNPIELIKTIDADNGRISYAVAISPNGTEKQGKGTVATIKFVANTQVAKATQISFLPKTLVTAQGVSTSILKSSSAGSILFQTTPTSILNNPSTTPSTTVFPSQ